MGSINAGRVAPNHRGSYSSSVSYSFLDVVVYNGSSYICRSQSGVSGVLPPGDGSYWGLLAEKGATGSGGGSGSAENGIPSGGSEGQALIKSSSSDYDASWGSLSYVPLAGTSALSGNIVPSGNNVRSLGSASYKFANLYVTTVSATTLSGSLNGSIASGSTAVTQASGDSSTKVATTAFVASAVSGLAPLASPALSGVPTVSGNMVYHSGNITLSNVAPSSSIADGHIVMVY